MPNKTPKELTIKFLLRLQHLSKCMGQSDTKMKDFHLASYLYSLSYRESFKNVYIPNIHSDVYYNVLIGVG